VCVFVVCVGCVCVCMYVCVCVYVCVCEGGDGAEGKRKKQKLFLVLNPRPGPDGPNASLLGHPYIFGMVSGIRRSKFIIRSSSGTNCSLIY